MTTQDRWPRLSTLPTTNAAMAVVLTLWLFTGFAALLQVPAADRWYQALETFTGIAVVQFGAKRLTHKPDAPKGDA